MILARREGSTRPSATTPPATPQRGSSAVAGAGTASRSRTRSQPVPCAAARVGSAPRGSRSPAQTSRRIAGLPEERPAEPRRTRPARAPDWRAVSGARRGRSRASPGGSPQAVLASASSAWLLGVPEGGGTVRTHGPPTGGRSAAARRPAEPGSARRETDAGRGRAERALGVPLGVPEGGGTVRTHGPPTGGRSAARGGGGAGLCPAGALAGPACAHRPKRASIWFQTVITSSAASVTSRSSTEAKRTAANRRSRARSTRARRFARSRR